MLTSAQTTPLLLHHLLGRCVVGTTLLRSGGERKLLSQAELPAQRGCGRPAGFVECSERMEPPVLN